MKRGVIKRALLCVKYWRTITNKQDYALGLNRTKTAKKGGRK